MEGCDPFSKQETSRDKWSSHLLPSVSGRALIRSPSVFNVSFFLNFIYFWLRWVSVAMRVLLQQRQARAAPQFRVQSSHWGASLVAGDINSVVVVLGLSCSAACGIFPAQGLNPCLLHWQVNSLPLSHQGSPCISIFNHWSFLHNLKV